MVGIVTAQELDRAVTYLESDLNALGGCVDTLEDELRKEIDDLRTQVIDLQARLFMSSVAGKLLCDAGHKMVDRSDMLEKAILALIHNNPTDALKALRGGTKSDLNGA